MNTIVNIPPEVVQPDENAEVVHTLPDRNWVEVERYGENTDSIQALKDIVWSALTNALTKDPDVTVHLSWDIDINSVKNWMKEHMEAYPTTADGFYARFIDYDEENKWYIVLPCNKREANSIKVNWIYYKIYPFRDNYEELFKNIKKELTETLSWHVDVKYIVESIKKKLLEVFRVLPLDKDWIIKFKDELIDYLLKDPTFINKFWKRKYIVLEYLNNVRTSL